MEKSVIYKDGFEKIKNNVEVVISIDAGSQRVGGKVVDNNESQKYIRIINEISDVTIWYQQISTVEVIGIGIEAEAEGKRR